jgi:hypothetical protein
MKSILALACALAVLMACSQSEPEEAKLSPEDAAQAATLLEQVHAAGKLENWEGAETLADQLRTQYSASPAANALALELPALRIKAEASRDQRRLRDLWTYQSTPVGKGQQRTATMYSRTPPVGEGEPAIRPDAQLVLRDHPAWGRSAYLLFAQSRFHCGTPCAMQISFDGGAPVRYAGKQADSGKGPALFIEDEVKFQQQMSRAKLVIIRLPEGSGSLKSLVFEVGGFRAERYDKP